MRNRSYRSERVDFERAGRITAALGLVGRHRGESVGLLIGLVAGVTILVNALFLQPGRHPAPIWANKPRPVADAAGGAAAEREIALPRARPGASHVAAAVPLAMPARSRSEIIADIQRELAHRGFYDGAADGVWGARTETAMRDFALAAGLKSPIEANEDLLRSIVKSPAKAAVGRATTAEPARNDAIAGALVPLKRILAVQHTLAEFGYGQIKPTGVFGPETQAAIETFERDRRLPVTGQISERVTRELAAMTGRTLE